MWSGLYFRRSDSPSGSSSRAYEGSIWQLQICYGSQQGEASGICHPNYAIRSLVSTLNTLREICPRELYCASPELAIPLNRPPKKRCLQLPES